MSTFEVYLWLKLDIFIEVLGVSGACLAIIMPVAYFTYPFRTHGKYKHLKKIIAGTVLGIILIISAILMPDTKQVAIMYVMPKILTETNVETLSEDASKMHKMVMELMEEKLKPTEKTLDK